MFPLEKERAFVKQVTKLNITTSTARRQSVVKRNLDKLKQHFTRPQLEQCGPPKSGNAFERVGVNVCVRNNIVLASVFDFTLD